MEQDPEPVEEAMEAVEQPQDPQDPPEPEESEPTPRRASETSDLEERGAESLPKEPEAKKDDLTKSQPQNISSSLNPVS